MNIQEQKCIKPNCNCLEIAERIFGGPVKNYQCLINSEDKTAENQSKTPNESLIEQLNKLQAFKDFVHCRLDEMSIEANPDGEHSKAGCRIGDRLDIVQSALSQKESPTVEEGELVNRIYNHLEDDWHLSEQTDAPSWEISKSIASIALSYSKEHAIGFAEWVARESYEWMPQTNQWRAVWDNYSFYTTEDLYNIYLQSLNKE